MTAANFLDNPLLPHASQECSPAPLKRRSKPIVTGRPQTQPHGLRPRPVASRPGPGPAPRAAGRTASRPGHPVAAAHPDDAPPGTAVPGNGHRPLPSASPTDRTGPDRTRSTPRSGASPPTPTTRDHQHGLRNDLHRTNQVQAAPGLRLPGLRRGRDQPPGGARARGPDPSLAVQRRAGGKPTASSGSEAATRTSPTGSPRSSPRGPTLCSVNGEQPEGNCRRRVRLRCFPEDGHQAGRSPVRRTFKVAWPLAKLEKSRVGGASSSMSATRVRSDSSMEIMWTRPR